MTKKNINDKNLFKHFQNQLILPDLKNQDVIFKPAETEAEFRKAFQVLHDCYVEKQFMSKTDSGVRITPYHLIASTVTLIAKIDEKVIGTVSIIKDNPIQLPCDSIFDLNFLRAKGKQIAEVSAFAILPEYRGKKGELFHRMMRYFWKFSRSHLNIDYFVCAVNPSMNTLYESIYNFQPLSQFTKHTVDQYDFVKGAPAVGLFVPVNDEINELWQNTYKEFQSNNLYQFMNEDFQSNELTFQNKYYHVYKNNYPYQLYRSFLNDTESVAQYLSKEKIKKFTNLLDHQKSNLIINSADTARKETRFNTFCELLNYDKQKIVDVSNHGLKLSYSEFNFMDDINYIFNVKLGPDIKTRIVVKKAWKNSNGQIGFKIENADRVWFEFLQFLNNLNSKGYQAA